MTQLARAGRLFLFTAAPAALAYFTNPHSVLTLAAVQAIVVPAAEVAWRSIFPATPDVPLASSTSTPAPSSVTFTIDEATQLANTIAEAQEILHRLAAQATP